MIRNQHGSASRATIYHENRILTIGMYIPYPLMGIPLITIRPDRKYFGGSLIEIPCIRNGL